MYFFLMKNQEQLQANSVVLYYLILEIQYLRFLYFILFFIDFIQSTTFAYILKLNII